MCKHQQGASLIIITVPYDALLAARYHDAEECLAACDILLDWSLWDAKMKATV